MTSYNLFPGPAPLVQAYDKGQSVNLGTSFKVTAPGWVTHIRYVSGRGSGGADVDYSQRVGVLWKLNVVGGTSYSYTKVAGPFTLPAPTGPDQWVDFTLPVPFALVPGQLYRIAVLHPNGGYPASTHYFDHGDGTTDYVYGPVVVPASGNVLYGMQGTFKYTPYFDDVPDSQYNAAAYYSDVTITDSDPAVVSNVFGADGTAYKAFTLVAGTLTEVIPTP